jgi:transposase-like protein
MAAAISPGSGRAYGVVRVYDGFGVARSSFYAWRRQQERTDPPPPPSRRGPRPAILGCRGVERHPRRSPQIALD